MKEPKQSSKKRIDWKGLFILQGIIIIYTLAGVAGKFAAGYGFLSKGFIICYAIEILILGVYAILWQQIIKRFDLSVAYANRSIALLWSMIWAIILFHEKLTALNIIGAVIIIIGTMIVNGDRHD